MRGEWERLAERIRSLAAPEHISALWLAVLAPEAPRRLLERAPQLASVTCLLLVMLTLCT